MLTRTGWILAAAAIAQLVVGRALGTMELVVTGVATGVTVLAALGHVITTSLRLEVRRDITPPKVHAGSASSVELRITNTGRRSSPVLEVHDAVSGTRGVSMLLAPLVAGETATIAYRLPTERRGVLTVGPLSVELSDPFGVAQTRTPVPSTAELTVFPRIDAVSPIPHTTGDDPHAGADHPNVLGRSGEDFYALRPYVVGDDLRRVHWPSTARHDDLLVRQDEVPWQSRATILLDTRLSVASDDAFEMLISAAASLVHASSRRQDLVRLVTSTGSDSGFATGHAAFDAIMEFLATLQGTRDDSTRTVEALLRSSTTGGALVVLVGDAVTRADVERLLGLRTRFGAVLVVQVDRSATSPSASVGEPIAPGALQIVEDRGFATVWNAGAAAAARPSRMASVR